MKQQLKNLRSTKRPQLPTLIPLYTPPLPVSPKTLIPAEDLTQAIYCHIEQTGQIYMDQTGHLPVTSSRGNKYIMTLYDYDSNAILTEPIKFRSEAEIIRAYSKIHESLTRCGFKPKLQHIDN